MCPYRARNVCWFGHYDDLEEVPLCHDVAATSSLPLRTGTPVYAGLEADSMDMKEIVDYFGYWEEIVDVPVSLRKIEDDLGVRFLQVPEQILEVLNVLPEQIASRLKGLGAEERFCVDMPSRCSWTASRSRSWQSLCRRSRRTSVPVPQILEAVERERQARAEDERHRVHEERLVAEKVAAEAAEREAAENAAAKAWADEEAKIKAAAQAKAEEEARIEVERVAELDRQRREAERLAQEAEEREREAAENAAAHARAD